MPLETEGGLQPSLHLIIKHFSGTRESFISISRNILLPFKLENQRLEGRNGLERASRRYSYSFLEQGVTVPTSDIEQRLNSLVYDFKVPIEEARRSVVSYFAKLHPKEGIASETEVIYAKIADINTEDRWINLRVRVVQLWEPNSPSIAQVGLLGDETGTIKFTSWSNAKLAHSQGRTKLLDT